LPAGDDLADGDVGERRPARLDLDQCAFASDMIPVALARQTHSVRRGVSK
jgi:hypothetical protein